MSGAAPSYAMMWQRLRLRQLRVAVAIAEHGSVLRAAQALGITQPAATRNLLELEDYLDIQLF
jgi:LysR family pca operon transcriptional activator